MRRVGRPIKAADLTHDVLHRMSNLVEFNEDGCWLWRGCVNEHGYARVKVQGHPLYGHRVVYALTYGAVQAGTVLRHRCDTPACVRPDHLTEGTQADNLRDMVAKGRHFHKVTPEQRRVIAWLCSRDDILQRDVAAMFHISPQHVSRIVRQEMTPAALHRDEGRATN